MYIDGDRNTAGQRETPQRAARRFRYVGAGSGPSFLPIFPLEGNFRGKPSSNGRRGRGPPADPHFPIVLPTQEDASTRDSGLGTQRRGKFDAAAASKGEFGRRSTRRGAQQFVQNTGRLAASRRRRTGRRRQLPHGAGASGSRRPSRLACTRHTQHLVVSWRRCRSAALRGRARAGRSGIRAPRSRARDSAAWKSGSRKSAAPSSCVGEGGVERQPNGAFFLLRTVSRWPPHSAPEQKAARASSRAQPDVANRRGAWPPRAPGQGGRPWSWTNWLIEQVSSACIIDPRSEQPSRGQERRPVPSAVNAGLLPYPPRWREQRVSSAQISHSCSCCGLEDASLHTSIARRAGAQKAAK